MYTETLLVSLASSFCKMSSWSINPTFQPQQYILFSQALFIGAYQTDFIKTRSFSQAVFLQK